jgi:CAAX prenyl protease-like protein/helix-turn-helix protein
MLMGAGLGLGALEYYILAPAPLVSSFSWGTIGLAALSLMVFTGLMEELLFRGLLQAVAQPVLGGWSIVYVSLLFATLHIGQLSALELVFAFGVGLLFAQLVRWSGSILGVALAHGMTNITLFLIMPYLAHHSSESVAQHVSYVIGGGIAIAAVAIAIIMVDGIISQTTPFRGRVPLTSMRMLRRSFSLTYVDLAQRTGLSVRLLAEIEYGLREPEPDQLHQIFLVLGVEPQFLSAAG